MNALMDVSAMSIDIRQAPLLRIQIAQSHSGGSWYALIQRHHLVSDHVSSDILLEEIRAYLIGREDELSTPVQYRNFVAQTLAQAESDSEAYFTNQLADIDEITAPFGLVDVHGDGQNIRDWLYVKDHCSALDVVIHKGAPGETYNIGGNNEAKNIDLVHTLCDLMDELAPTLPTRPARDLITFVKDRPGHDRRYAIDATKIASELGWTPAQTLEQGLRSTLEWYLANQDWWQPLLSEEYQQYYKQVYA